MNRILVLVITMLSLLLEAGMGQERMLTCEFTDGTEPLSHDIYRNRGDKRIVLDDAEKTQRQHQGALHGGVARDRRRRAIDDPA